MSEWISVNDSLPEARKYCLLAMRFGVRYGYRRVKEPKQRGGQWFVMACYYEDDAVTHWMPLPDPPDKEQQ